MEAVQKVETDLQKEKISFQHHGLNKKPWMQMPHRPLSGPRCMQIEASRASPQIEAPEWPRRGTSAGWFRVYCMMTPGGGRRPPGT